ncbi:MAG: tetratricopeptide repeat protein [Pseudolabrys sp.]|nr:tetratricopeptide repeat protein [Pseudolabrys sp.]
MMLPAAKPQNVPQLLEQALTYHHAGRLAEADRLYGAILSVRPEHFDALQMRGLIRLASGDLAEALRLIAGALKLRPKSPQVLLNYGIVLEALKRHEEALEHFNLALKHKKKYAEALNNRGAVLLSLGRDKEALEDFEAATAAKPDYAEAWSNMGAALKSLVRYDDALAAIERALKLNPKASQAHNNRGMVLAALKRDKEALECYEHALLLNPYSYEAYHNRGSVKRGLGKQDEALADLSKAIALNPTYGPAYYNRGSVLTDINRAAEAVASFKMALQLKPSMREAKLAAVIAELPIIYHDENDIAERRTAYAQHLAAVNAEITEENAADFIRGTGANQPFYLAYQGQNDRELQKIYGSTVCRIVEANYPPAPPVAPPAPDEPIRVGIVSAFYYHHSNWKIPIKGWLSQMDRSRFHLFCYHTGLKQDAETEIARSMCDKFVHGAMSMERWREIIEADQPHVIIYPEVGMDGVSMQLAAQRIAPIQVNSWGHPETSGFPTLDYFLSSDLMEIPSAQDHYSEKLVRLSNLSIYYEPQVAKPVEISRAELGLSDDKIVFWCGQSVYKYLPQYDRVFAQIAKRVGNCQFAFLKHFAAPVISDIFYERLGRAFAAEGLNASDYCVVLPRLDRDKFVAAIGQSDVVLDSIGWSGCNSTLEGLEHNMPAVTMDGEFMRGRHSTAIFRMMGVTDTIASSVDDYIALAVKLAQNPALRAEIKTKIEKNKARLFYDRAPVKDLEDFLERVVRGD